MYFKIFVEGRGRVGGGGRRGGVEDFFCRGRLDGKGETIFGGASGF